MKIFVDKGRGICYHKPDCFLIVDGLAGKSIGSHYEPVRQSAQKVNNEYPVIKVEGRSYRPCPRCFSHGKRK